MTATPPSPSFRLAYVPGVTPTKWVRIWEERLPGVPLTLLQKPAAEACAALRAAEADAGLVRMPVGGDDLSAIPLYTETTVVVLPRDHLVAAAEEVSLDDLADDLVLHPLDDPLDWELFPGLPAKQRPATTADAVELVAAGVGLLVVPQSLARLHHRRDLTYRPVRDAVQSRVALSWPQAETTDLVEQFIGIVRGRTVNSTRGRPAPASAERPAQKQDKAPAKGEQRRGDATGRAQKGRSGRGGPGAAKGGRRGRSRRR